MSKADDPQLYASGYERNRLDRYWTNPWMTRELVKAVPIPGPIWECAAGRGDMSKALIKETMLPVYSSDIDTSEFDKSIGPGHECSFLDEFEVPSVVPRYEQFGEFGENKRPDPVSCRSIITNPPYSSPWRGIADDFIKQGLSFFGEDGVIFMAMLLRSEFKSGKSRKAIFGDCEHYMGELVLTTRPRWDYGDPDAPENAAPRHNFSWFLWSYEFRKGGTSPVQMFSYMEKGFKP